VVYIGQTPPELRRRGARPPQGGACVFSQVNRTNVYIDGFNLYNRALKNTAALITSDSDFIEPIRIVRDRLGKKVIVFSPSGKCARLRDFLGEDLVLKWIKKIPKSQFPDILHDAKGVFSKPRDW